MNTKAQRRLLDMLHGWASYTDKCDAASETDPYPGVAPGEYRHEADAIEDLYQRAGGIDCMASADVEAFVRELVFPLLLEGKAPLLPTDEEETKR